VTEARLEHVPASVDDATVFLAQAHRFVRDAGAAGLSRTSRQLLLYHACLAACDAVLRASGRRVEGAEGGHALRLRETARVLDLDDELLDALDEARLVRAGSAYRAGLVMDHDVAEAADAAALLVEKTGRFLAGRRG
jgi:hypothetical protein